MKRILLSFCVLTVACSVAVAQNVKTAPMAAHSAAQMSKSSFTTKTHEFDMAVKNNNQAKVQSSFEDVKSMMQTHMGETKMAVESAKTKEERELMMNNLKKQQVTYTEVMQLSKDMKANHQAINEKLKTFSESY